MRKWQALALARVRGGAWLPQELQSRRAGLRRGQASLGQHIERLTEAYVSDALGLDEYRRRRADVEQRRTALARQGAQLAAEAEQHDEVAGLAAHAEDFCRRVAQGPERADFARKRELVELLIGRVVVTDDLVESRYVVPSDPAGEPQRFSLLPTDFLFPLPTAGSRPASSATARPCAPCSPTR